MSYYSMSNDPHYTSSEAYKVNSMLDKPIESTGATIGEVGASANPFEHQTKALMARIKEGASRVEFSFMGQGKGNKQSFTPETFGTVERQEMRQLAKLNEVETSTHASPSTGPLSGFGERGFNEETRRGVVKEIQKAIDFAAEATTGGAIVFHVGEWQRPYEGTFKDEEKKGTTFRKFTSDEYYDKTEKRRLSFEEVNKLKSKGVDLENNSNYRSITEKDRAQFMLADEETGQVTALSRDMNFYMPVIDEKLTKESLALGGPTIYKVIDQGVEKGKVELKERTFDQVLEEYKKRAEFENDTSLTHHRDGSKKTDEEIVYQAFQDKEYQQAIGDSLRWATRVPLQKKQLENLDNEAKSQQTLLDATKKQLKQENPALSDKEINTTAYQKLTEQIRRYGDEFPLITEAGSIDKNAIDRHKKELIASIHSDQSTGSGQMQRALQIKKQIDNTRSIKDIGLKKTADTIARAAIYADQKTNEHRKDLKHELYVAPESYLPDQYGGHPDEIREVIKASRKRMVELLRNKYSEKEASEIAVKRIKATLDIGHLNQWRQYLVRKPNETIKDYDKRFNKWILDKTEGLAKDGMVGHAHLSDNFGYDDEHLVPGEGNAPVSEFVKRMRKRGVNEFIQEPGSFNFDYALHDTWKNLGVTGNVVSGTYSGAKRALPSRFDEFHRSYFGHTAKPSYVFGKYMPQVQNIEKSWAPWSGTPL